MAVEEAQTEETRYGKYVTTGGWFVHNLGEALAVRFERGTALYPLEPRDAPFSDFGVNVRVLWPGEPNALYHSEQVQEGFLVLAGECVLIVEEQERRLRAWDYVHCPAGTRHVFVGAGETPCTIVMIGARPGVEQLRFPVSEAAATFGASVAEETADGDVAYADWPQGFDAVRLPWPPE